MDLGIEPRHAIVRGASRGLGCGRARDVVRQGVTVNDLLTGRFDTDRRRSNRERFAAHAIADVERFRDRMRNDVAVRRFGTIEEFGATWAFLCSRPAAFISGRNALLDGGLYCGPM